MSSVLAVVLLVPGCSEGSGGWNGTAGPTDSTGSGSRSQSTTADLKVSIHADGSRAPGAHGFHVIAPAEIEPWTVDGGLATSTYDGIDGIDVRGDLGTLNPADIPTVLVELGNMRDAGDAVLMTSVSGRRDYASALAAAVERFVAL